MKAIVQGRYGAPGDVLRLQDIDEPLVDDDAVLVRVRATSVNPADWHLIRGNPYIARLQFGLRRPKDAVAGCDVAGHVEAVGSGVSRLRPGDEVLGCPFGRGLGTFAERVCISEDRVAVKPANLSFDQAAAVPLAALTALQGLRDHGAVKPGHRVLIIGASGGVGTFAVQIAKCLGAEVTGACSTRNVDLVRSIGADHVIDYRRQDVIEAGLRYDVIFQIAGTLSPSDCRRALTARGTLVLISGDSDGNWIGPVGRTIKALALSPFVGQKLTSFLLKPNAEDLQYLASLIEDGRVTPVIDRTYSLSEVPEALGYLEAGRARGKVVIAVGSCGRSSPNARPVSVQPK